MNIDANVNIFFSSKSLPHEYRPNEYRPTVFLQTDLIRKSKKKHNFCTFEEDFPQMMIPYVIWGIISQ